MALSSDGLSSDSEGTGKRLVKGSMPCVVRPAAKEKETYLGEIFGIWHCWN